jgi:hypothetical protein
MIFSVLVFYEWAMEANPLPHIEDGNFSRQVIFRDFNELH